MRKYTRNDLITTRDSPAGFLFAIITVSDRRNPSSAEFRSENVPVFYDELTAIHLPAWRSPIVTPPRSTSASNLIPAVFALFVLMVA